MNCTVTMKSREVPGHTHTCSSVAHVTLGGVTGHVCDDPTCRRWYGVKS